MDTGKPTNSGGTIRTPAARPALNWSVTRYRESFFPLARWEDHRVGLASARAGNVIGGGDWTARQLIPDTIAAFLQARPVVLRHPQSVRPWQHVLDCLAGYLTLAEALRQTLEPTPETGTLVLRTGTRARFPTSSRPWRRAGEHRAGVGAGQLNHPPEEDILRLDVTKSGTLLGGYGRLLIDDAIRWVADWYRDFHDGRDARVLCLRADSHLPRLDASVQA